MGNLLGNFKGDFGSLSLRLKTVKKPLAVLGSYIVTTLTILIQKIAGLIDKWNQWDAILCVVVIITAFFVTSFQVDELIELFGKRQTRAGQRKKMAQYFSGIHGRVMIFSTLSDPDIWNDEVFTQLNRIGASNVEIFVKNLEEAKKSNSSVNVFVNHDCLKEWEPLRQLLGVDYTPSDFILVERANNRKEFRSFLTENQGKIYQKFDHSGSEHPIVSIAEDFYKIVRKISDFSENLKGAIGYYFVQVSVGSSDQPQFSLVHVHSKGQYGIGYRGVALDNGSNKISHEWHSTAASFHQENSSLLFFTAADNITHYPNSGTKISNMGFIKFTGEGTNNRSVNGQFYDIGDNGSPMKQASITLTRVTENHLKIVNSLSLNDGKLKEFDDFFDGGTSNNRTKLEELVLSLSNLF
jgi:hypothetical protein